MMDRRNFLRNAGFISAGVATSPVLHALPLIIDTFPNCLAGRLTHVGNLFESMPIDHGRALINPNMGWTFHFYSNVIQNYGSKLEPSDTIDYFPGVSTVYLRLPWAFIEPEEGVFAWETLDTPAQRWIEKGKRVAFRITATESWMYFATPKWVFELGAKGYDVENNCFEPDYDDPIFLEKVENFVRTMAERYDGNEQIAFIDVGHFGMWGEGHTLMTSPKHGHYWSIETQKKHIDLYCRHFKQTLLCISDDFAGHDKPGTEFPIMEYAFSKGVTMRDDSILVQPTPRHWYHAEMAQRFWPTLPVILEHEHYSSAKARGSWNEDLLLRSIEDYHASYISIHWWPDLFYKEMESVIHSINRRLGYRLRLDNVKWPQTVVLGSPFNVESIWSNVGVAPCYKGGNPCYTLKDDKGGIVSVLVDHTFNVKSLTPAKPDAPAQQSHCATFNIAPHFIDRGKCFFRDCAPGKYNLFVSVGKPDGTPIYTLPFEGEDGKKRYCLGTIEVLSASSKLEKGTG